MTTTAVEMTAPGTSCAATPTGAAHRDDADGPSADIRRMTAGAT